MKKALTLPFFVFFTTLILAQNQPLQISFGNLHARSIGPAVMSGRISTIDGVHKNPQVIYIGAASGGIWKSNSGGASFSPIFDEHTQSIGAICIDQNHPDTVWAGTGEPWVRNSVSVGTGLYVTTNGGRSWDFKGLGDSERISQVIVDPNNSGTIYVAAQGHLWGPNEERGVYKSTDFGATWQRILYVDENTGAADLSMDPTNPNVLYAAMWEHRRSPDFFNSGGKGSGLFKTTDGGATWQKITPENGLPTGILGRMAVAIAPSNPNVVYLTVEAEKQADRGLYKSTDAGKSFKKINGDFGITVRPFYFSRLEVGPTDEKKLFKCGLNLSISEDGGETFRTVGSGVHSDSHAVWVNPNNPKHIVIGTDGGGYRSLDGGYYFEMFMDLPLSQFYHVSVDDEEPYNVYGGLQDNGTWYAPSSSPGGIQNKNWELSYYGDGFFSFRHPTDPDVVYSESQGGYLVRYDKSDGQAKDIRPLPAEGEPEYRFNWNSPIHLSPNNPERMYFGAQFLFMTEDRGNSWKKISPDLTTNDPQRQRQKKSGGLSIDNSGAENNTTLYAIAESPVDEKIIWVGTDDGNVQVTSDAGKTWTNTAANMPGLPAGLWVTQVEPSRFNKNTCYVTVDGHRSNDKKPYVFKTTDLGKTWTSLVTPGVEGYAHVIREDLGKPNLLFLGTEFGLYLSVDGGQSWKRFTDVPKVGVYALAIQPREAALVIGTHGRGIYILDDLTPLRQITAEVAEQTLHFFKTKPAYIRLPRSSEPFGGAGNFVGENPKDVAYITYFMKKRHTFGSMTMEVYGPDGRLVKELTPGKSGGINIVELPTRLPMPKAAPTKNMQALGGSLSPPPLPEGAYTVKILKGKEEFTTTVDLQFDPKAGLRYPAADRKLSLETQMRLYDMTEQLAYVYAALEDMHTQAADRSGKAGKKLAASLTAFSKEVEKTKNGLVALEGDGYVDEGYNLREDISTLNMRVSNYPGKPSEAQLRQTDLLEKRMAEVQTKFENFKMQMNKLNGQLAKEGGEVLKIKTWEAFKAE